MPRKSVQRPTLQLNVRIEPRLVERLDEHVKASRMTRAQIVEGALARLFDAVDREAARVVAEAAKP